MSQLIWICIGGALGTVGRFSLARAAGAIELGGLPWGTWAVNVLGSLLFGLAFAWCDGRWAADSTARLALFVGFFGAFTTFSTLAFEGASLLGRGEWAAAALHMLGQNLVGLGAVLLGLWIGRGTAPAPS